MDLEEHRQAGDVEDPPDRLPECREDDPTRERPQALRGDEQGLETRAVDVGEPFRVDDEPPLARVDRGEEPRRERSGGARIEPAAQPEDDDLLASGFGDLHVYEVFLR